MATKKQFYGIKFPFTNNNEDGFLIDLNSNNNEKVGSEIAHVILTPKGTRIMMPEFGTDLIKYLFNPNDNSTWSDIEDEIKSSVSKYVPDTTIQDVGVIKDENNDNAIYVDIKYGVKRGMSSVNNRMVIKL